MGAHKLGQKRQFMSHQRTAVANAGKKRECPAFFLDSGAHSLYTEHVLPQKGRKDRYQYYVEPGTTKFTSQFKAYLDAYAKFVRKYKAGMDHYATVDAIYNPEISWKSLMYLIKEHGLDPVPVIHHKTPMKWIDKHLDYGFTYIGLGGLGQESNWSEYTAWADPVYARLCPASNGYKPIVKTHGFAATAYQMLIRYPWYSVDSASWAKAAGFGSIYVPHRRNGQWDFTVKPYAIGVSFRSTAAGRPRGHYLTLSKSEQQVVLNWLKEIDVPLGKRNEKTGEMEEYGVFSTYHAAATANVKFFNRLCQWLPEWPWAFLPKPKRNTFIPEDKS